MDADGLSRTPRGAEQTHCPPLSTSDGLVDTCCILSLAYFMLHCPNFWYSAGPVFAFALPALVSPGLRAKPWMWLAIAASLVLGVAPNWFEADNHKYVSIYWAIALACARWVTSSQGEVLACNARFLLAGCMFFATLWKAISPTYLSGEFFEFSLLTDGRFATFLNTMTPLDAEVIESNHKAYNAVRSGLHPPGSYVELGFAPSVATIALLCTYWTIMIEGLLALVFLLPASRVPTWLRDGSLIAFGATTYFLAPVPGFGCLLMLMGMAQSKSTHTRLFKTYFFLFVLIQAAPNGVRAIWQFLAP